jgi:heterodisulfide reductase subunit A
VEKEPEKIEDQIRKSLADSIRKSYADSNFGDVMVVGGGISGIQASLDLATAGFKVYLVEKAPSIGGHMAQLDKTFPTNDCSM